MLGEQDATVRWAARDRIVAASREFEINGTPSTMLTLEMLAMNGYNRCVRGAFGSAFSNRPGV